MLKIHVRKGTGNGCDDIPLCGFNNARGYRHLPASVVKSAKEFRETDSEKRCQHCENLYLIHRNRQRKAKGKPPVKTAFEGF